MNDQPKPPSSGGSSGTPSPLRQSVTSATERIQVIIEAAEKAAAGIIEDAEVQAQRYLEESRRRADLLAEERARVMTSLTDSLIQQAEEVKRQSGDLITALDQAKGQIEERISEELAAIPAPDVGQGPVGETPAPPLQEAPEPAPEVPHLKPVEPPPPPPPPAAVPDAEPPGEENGAGAPTAEAGVAEPETEKAPEPEEALEPEKAPEPEPEAKPKKRRQAKGSKPPPAAAAGGGSAGAAPSAGARLLATQMAVAGSSRDEIESRLRNEFGIDDAEAMLDSILGPEG
jgi:hypothetical protein